MRYNVGQIQSLLRQAGWPENLVLKMSGIVMYESNGDSTANNPKGEDSWGLTQVNWPWHKEYSRERLIEPIYNLQAGYAIYQREGWRAWFNSNNKWNSNYLGIADQARAAYSENMINNTSNTTAAAPPLATTNNNLLVYGAIAVLVGAFVLRS